MRRRAKLPPLLVPAGEPAAPYDWTTQGDRRDKKRQGRRLTDDPSHTPLDPLEAATRESARRRLMEVKQQIQAKTAEMFVAEPARVPVLAQELQRLRVSMLMLREIVEDVADPNAYRELSLLNKMMTGHDPEASALRKEQEEAEADAAARLAKVGLSSEQAGGMVRVLEALGSVMARPHGADRVEANGTGDRSGV